MTGVLFACVAGLLLGARNVTIRVALGRLPDIDAGSAAMALVAFAAVGLTALVAGADVLAGELWPFLLLGAFVPGASQVLVAHAVKAAGASRAGILFGMAPLFSALLAVVAFGESFRWALAAGTLLVVAGGVALAWEGERPAGYRAYGAVLAVAVAAAFGLRDNWRARPPRTSRPIRSLSRRRSSSGRPPSSRRTCSGNARPSRGCARRSCRSRSPGSSSAPGRRRCSRRSTGPA